jgi:hypothetical protein
MLASLRRRPDARRLARSRTVWVSAVGLMAVGAWLAVTSLATTGGPIAWSGPVQIVPSSLLAESATSYSPAGLSCHAGPLCVAVTEGGYALTTSTPSATGGFWGIAAIDPTHPLTAVACPSSTLCVAADRAGDVLSSLEPTAGGSAWRLSDVDGSTPITSVSCPSTRLCVAGDQSGSILTSTEPTGGPEAWSSAPIDTANAPILGVSCPTVLLCVAVDQFGDVLSSTEPMGGVGAWERVDVDARHSFMGGISCPSVSLCVAADSDGNVATSTNPMGGARAWTVTPIGDQGRSGVVSCASARLCAKTLSEGRVSVSSDPAGESPDWTSMSIDEPGSLLVALSCTGELVCMALDTTDHAVLGTSAAASESLAVSLAGAGHGSVSGAGISCPPLCGAAYPAGTAVTLVAAPAGGSTFTGWSGACSGSGPCVLSMSTPASVTATFAPVATRAGFLLSVTLGGLGEGRVLGDGIACPPTCAGSYPPGADELLTATPARGSAFAGWGGAGRACMRHPTCQVHMSREQAVKATFLKATPPLLAITRLTVRPARGLAVVQFTARRPVARVACALTAHQRSSARRPRFAPCRSPASFHDLHKGTYTLTLHGFTQRGATPVATATRRFTLR